MACIQPQIYLGKIATFREHNLKYIWRDKETLSSEADSTQKKYFRNDPKLLNNKSLPNTVRRNFGNQQSLLHSFEISIAFNCESVWNSRVLIPVNDKNKEVNSGSCISKFVQSLMYKLIGLQGFQDIRNYDSFILLMSPHHYDKNWNID